MNKLTYIKRQELRRLADLAQALPNQVGERGVPTGMTNQSLLNFTCDPEMILLFLDKIDELDERNRKLLVALEGLVHLKNYRDQYGKDESYESLHPVIWSNARKAVVKYSKK